MSLSGAQRLCMAVIIVGFIVSLTGYVSPYWEYISVDDNVTVEEYRVGLIFGCYTRRTPIGTTSNCQVIDWDNAVDEMIFFKAVRLLAVTSLLFYTSSCVVAAISCCNCRKITSVVYFSSLAIMGGLTGVAAGATFAAFSEGNTDFIEELKKPGVHLHKGWAFYLSTSGSCAVLLLGILSLNAPKKRTMYVFTATNESTRFSNSGYQRFK
ncbi:unnamed protein product [Candidula unifasciata]|uniref:Claudin n=1 Tax=Candidula unifasciata TaxID=100452 RepID=A0A8S3Z406_9EUPU|nr:unnamed protein product [Candidula unifasciata]